MKRVIKNKEAFDFDEDDMPCLCEVCSEWFDLNDGYAHPRKGNITICSGCADRIEKEKEVEEEIEWLKTEISDAKVTIELSMKRLEELGHKIDDNEKQ